MLDTPIAHGLLAMATWGVWAVLANVATETIPPEVAMILSYVTGAAIAVGYVLVGDTPLTVTREGLTYSLAAGVFSGVAAVAFYAGLKGGETGPVTTVSALYFVVAALIGWTVLGEPASLREVAGVGFAVVAVALLAG